LARIECLDAHPRQMRLPPRRPSHRPRRRPRLALGKAPRASAPTARVVTNPSNFDSVDCTIVGASFAAPGECQSARAPSPAREQ
jgi:hypothetical protein